MPKNPQDTIKPKNNRKSSPIEPKRDPVNWAIIYKDVFDMEGQASIPFLKQLAVDLMEWAIHDTDAYKTTPFLTARRISRKKYNNWRKKYQFLEDADDFARTVLGDRREKKGLEDDWNTQIVIKSMHMFDPEWKESEEWRATLAEKVAAAQQHPNITGFDLGDGVIIKFGSKNDDTNETK